MIDDKIKDIMQKLLDAKFEVYIIGGFVRDSIMGIEPHDIDLFTNATGKQILEIFPNGKILGSEERQEKILTVIVDDVEISQYRSSGDRTEVSNTLEEHQKTCDFTINSIAMDINGEIIDTQGGQEDIENGILRFIGDAKERISEDYLRLARAVRFICKYELDTDYKTYNILGNNMKKLKELPVERLNEEMIKIFKVANADSYEFESFILDTFPIEFRKCLWMNGGNNHNELVHEHMFNSLRECCKITDKPLLRMAAFLHDIGKGVTQTFDEENKQTHFYKHEKKGKKIVEDWMNDLKFSKEDIKYISTLVALHMYSYKDSPSKKSYIRFFNKLKDANIPIEDYIMLIYSDHQGNLAKPRIKFGDFIRDNWLYKKYQEITYSNEPMTVKDLAISGKDLIDRYKLTPGPEFAKILKDIHNRIMDGDLINEKTNIFEYIDSTMELK